MVIFVYQLRDSCIASKVLVRHLSRCSKNVYLTTARTPGEILGSQESALGQS